MPPFAHREEVKVKDHVVTIEGLSDRGATHYEVIFYPLELGQEYKIYLTNHIDGEEYTVAYQYGQQGFQEVPLEPVLKKAIEASDVFHFDGNTFTAYKNQQLVSELKFDYSKYQFRIHEEVF